MLHTQNKSTDTDNTKISELLHTQTNAQNTENKSQSETGNEKLIERHPIKGTPFWIIGNKEKGFALTFGKWRLTENFDIRTEVQEHLDDNSYDIILKMICCLLEETQRIITDENGNPIIYYKEGKETILRK